MFQPKRFLTEDCKQPNLRKNRIMITSPICFKRKNLCYVPRFDCKFEDKYSYVPASFYRYNGHLFWTASLNSQTNVPLYCPASLSDDVGFNNNPVVFVQSLAR